MEPIGFLGLGIMGSAMARNLLQAGYPVRVWNRSPQRCAALLAEGAEALPSPREVTACSAVTFAMVSDPDAALAVALGLDGAVAGLGARRGYVDCSTVSPDTAQEIAAAVAAAGGRFLEAPVSGSKGPAEDGSLVFLAGGDRSLFDRVRPELEVMGKLAVYVGEPGQGAVLKLVVNMIMGEMMTALGEGLSLAGRAGLHADQLLQVLDAGAVANPMFRHKGPRMDADNFEVNFPLTHMQKDLRLALDLGDRLAQPLPGAAAANELFKAARGAGLGDLDFSAVVQVQRAPPAP